jgi:molybdate transport system regulatory protein
MRTSARNQWPAEVVELRSGVVNDQVDVRLAGGAMVCATVTGESVENLGLTPGRKVVVLVKAASVMVGVPAERVRISARNQLPGKITQVTPGAVNTEVVIELDGGQTVASIITRSAADDLGVAVGRPATAIFKASSVILGTVD